MSVGGGMYEVSLYVKAAFSSNFLLIDNIRYLHCVCLVTNPLFCLGS